MKSRVVLSMLALAGATAGAQANSCGTGAPVTSEATARANAARDACQMAVDVFQFMAPQFGVALTGGNATLGKGGTLGGIGHFSVGVRANVLMGDLPEVTDFPAPRIAQTQPGRELPSKNQILGLPVVDAAFGIYKGFPLGLTNVGGIDLLVNAAYVPTVGDSLDNLRIAPETNLKLGYGARIGLLQESLLVPGISVTYIKRDVPTTTISGTSTDIDINIADASIETTAWRVVASKDFLVFGIAAGFGQDKYSQSASFSGRAKNISFGGGNFEQSFAANVGQDMTRNNMFVDLSMNLPFLKLVGEVGKVSGGTVNLANTFSSGAADDSRLFGSVGLRFAW